MVLGVEQILLDEKEVFFHLSIASWRLGQTRYFEKGVVHLKLYTICLSCLCMHSHMPHYLDFVLAPSTFHQNIKLDVNAT